jgi:hypothetical protein
VICLLGWLWLFRHRRPIRIKLEDAQPA